MRRHPPRSCPAPSAAPPSAASAARPSARPRANRWPGGLGTSRIEPHRSPPPAAATTPSTSAARAGTRYLGEQWCADCVRPCRALGLGCSCGHCGDLLTLDELLAGEVLQCSQQLMTDPPPQTAPGWVFH